MKQSKETQPLKFVEFMLPTMINFIPFAHVDLSKCKSLVLDGQNIVIKHESGTYLVPVANVRIMQVA